MLTEFETALAPQLATVLVKIECPLRGRKPAL